MARLKSMQGQTGTRQRLVAAGVVDDDDLVGRPRLTAECLEASTEQVACIPVDDDHSDGHLDTRRGAVPPLTLLSSCNYGDVDDAVA
jgi:hypothetical protein